MLLLANWEAREISDNDPSETPKLSGSSFSCRDNRSSLAQGTARCEYGTWKMENRLGNGGTELVSWTHHSVVC